MARLATSGLSVVWVPLKATRTNAAAGGQFGLRGPGRGRPGGGPPGFWGVEKISLTAPCSTTRPASKIATLRQICSTTLIWWVIDDHRDAEFAVDVLDQLQNGVGGVGVKRAGGLVAQQDLGIGGKGAGDGHALLLPAGELRRVAFRFVRQADESQQLFGAGFGLFLRHAGQLHREADVFQAVCAA